MATKNGIDVSKWQGTIDWAKVKATGKVDFAILRAGYGKLASQKDPKFEEYYTGATAQNIPVGVYWYSYAKTANEAKQEAEACYQCIKGKKFEYPIFFDYEESSQANSSVAAAVIPAFLEAMKAKGYYVGIYSYYSMLKSYIPSDLQKKYDVWVAHYATSTPYTGHTIWQYTSTANINGISGNVDMDYVYVDYPSIIKEAGLNGFTKAITTTTTSTTTTSNKTSTSTSTKAPDITYQAYTTKWLPAVTNYNTTDTNGYAGIENKKIYGLAAKSSSGTLKYRVHTVGGSWLPWVSKYNISDWNNGVAGVKNKVIDGIQFELTGVSGYTIKYRVSTTSSSTYLPWVTGWDNTNNGYAGIYGKSIDKIQVYAIKK